MTAVKRNGAMWPKVLLGLVGTGTAIWILLTSMGAAGTRKWEAYAAALRAKGQPLTFMEIEASRPGIAAEANGARIIEELATAFGEQRGGAITINSVLGKEAGDFFTGMRKGQIASGREYLSKYADILGRLSELRARPTGRFSIEYNKTNPLDTLLNHTVHVRTVSKLLALSSNLHLIDAEREAALRDFELQCRLAATLDNEPMLISRLVQIAVQSQSIQTLEALLRTGPMDAAGIDLAMRELRAMQQPEAVKWSLLGERAFFVETCEAILAGRVPLTSIHSDETGLTSFWPSRGLPAFWLRANQLRGAQMYTSLIDAVGDPSALRVATKKFDQEAQNIPRTQVLLKILLPSLTRAVTLNIKNAASRDCAIAALAAEKFRVEQGRLPASLDVLVPQYLPSVPVDPFDGKPLRLAKTDQGIVIYSVDEDEKDDGGVVSLAPDDKSRKRAPDLGFRLLAAEHRGVLIVEDEPRPQD